MIRNVIIFGLLAVLLAGPFLLRPEQDLLRSADATLVIVTPHNEAIRYEFARAFADHMQARTGKTVRIDWRVPGGTSEIRRYLQSEYTAAFGVYWRNVLGRRWDLEVQGSFDNPRVDPDGDGIGSEARRIFLDSDVGIGIDLFFGGGTYDFDLQAAAGRLIDSGILERHPTWFSDASIPQEVSGEPYWDPEGRWVGTCLSAFGICYNTDVLKRLGVETAPTSWVDLGEPIYIRQVAMADPTKSGSIAKAFEMLIQQQMQERLDALKRETGLPRADLISQAVEEGWVIGLQLIQRIGANARYFTDSAGKVPLDVSLGDAAIGMCIDFFGRYQSEAVARPDGTSRLQYFTPPGGSSIGVDPIGLLRGAPNSELALEFMEFVLSIEGQKLWNFQVGTPGGPVRYALRRLPVRKEMYQPQYREFMSDPDVDPYTQADLFYYHESWTAPLFSAMSFIIRVMCLDTHDELRRAWSDLVEAGFPPEATEVFQDMSAVTYAMASGPIRDSLRDPDRLTEVRLARDLGDHFRAQYRETSRLAREGR